MRPVRISPEELQIHLKAGISIEALRLIRILAGWPIHPMPAQRIE